MYRGPRRVFPPTDLPTPQIKLSQLGTEESGEGEMGMLPAGLPPSPVGFQTQQMRET